MMIVNVPKSVLYAAEAAVLLNISVQKVYQLLHAGKIKGYKYDTSNAWRIPAESVINYVKECENVKGKGEK